MLKDMKGIRVIEFDATLAMSCDESSYLEDLLSEVCCLSYLVIDLGGVSYLNSKALGVIFRLAITKNKNRVFLVNVHEHIKAILKVVSFHCTGNIWEGSLDSLLERLHEKVYS